MNSVTPNTTSAEADPFAEDVSKVDTSFPVLKGDKVYRFEITNPVRSVTKKTADRPPDEQEEMITVELKTTQDAKSTKGIVIHPGYVVFHRVMITPTKDRSVDNIKRDLAEVGKAAGLKGVTARQLMDDCGMLSGKIVDAKVTVEPEKDGFPEKNAIKRGGFVPVV